MAKKSASKRGAAKKKPTRKKSASAKSLAPSKTKRGLEANEVGISIDHASVSALAEEIRNAGGSPLAAYREPLSGRPLLLASLPIKAVEPTPFQRDLSPTHVKRLAQKIEESGSFLDSLIVVRGAEGGLWTPNGRHRLAAAKVLGLKQITALVSPDEDLSFKILALNTEKAHNLKDRSLEVIRRGRALCRCGLQPFLEEGRPFQFQDPGSEPQRARGLCVATRGDQRRGRAKHRGADGARLQVPVPTHLCRCEDQPRPLSPGKEGRDRPSDGDRSRADANGRVGEEVRCGIREARRPCARGRRRVVFGLRGRLGPAGHFEALSVVS
jgi:hypothetical protein